MRIRGVFFATLKSRAEAHRVGAIDVVAAEDGGAEVHEPRAARAVLRRRPVNAREAFVQVARVPYV